MPLLLSENKVGVSKDELICVDTQGLWNDWETLRKQLTRDAKKDYGLRKISTGGNGRKLLIDFDSLPKEAQKHITDPRKVSHIVERYYIRRQDAVDFYTTFKTQDGQYLLPEAQQRYIANASVMEALLQLKQAREIERSSKGGSSRGILATLASDAESFKAIMLQKYGYEHNLPTSKRFTVIFRDYRKTGFISLVKDVKGKAKVNARKVTDETIELLNNLFSGQANKPNPTEIHVQYDAFIKGLLQVVNDSTGEIYEPTNFKALSESSIRTYLTAWESSIATHVKRNGDRQKYMTQFTPYHSFTQPAFAGSIISIDDRQPPFEYEKGKRAWFYNGIDLASECFTACVWGKTKEGIILEFYRQLVRNYHEWGFNIPHELECESSLNSSFTHTFLEEGNMFQKVNMYANKARSKRIEAYYKPLRYQLEKQREGWLARPFAISEPNQISNAPKLVVPYNQLIAESIKDINTWNNMEHSKIKGKTRWEVFCENQNPNLSATNYKAFLKYVGQKTLSSCNTGIVRLNSRLWLLGADGQIQTGESLIQLMRNVEGQEIEIFSIDDNHGKIFKALVYKDGRYICELLAKPVPNKAAIERTPQDELDFNLMQRYEATVNGFMRTEKNKLDTVTVIDFRKKTLNNSFVMPGTKTEAFEPNEQHAEIIEDIDIENEYNPNEKVTSNGWNSAFKI
jgi:hypothetical protein